MVRTKNEGPFGRNNLLTLPLQKKTSLGVYIGDTGEAVAEMAAYAGFDYMRIDLEHTFADAAKLQNLIRIAEAADIPTLVRVARMDDVTAILDFGASGVLVPDISTAAQAREAVRRTKFAPIGERGMTNIGRVVRYSRTPLSEYFPRANEETALCVQIESQEGLDNLDEILAVPGVDIVTTGRQDLSQSLGVPGQSAHPLVDAAEETVIRKAVERGLQVMITAGTPERMRELNAKGVYLNTICFDVQFITERFAELVNTYRR
ncbi:MAG: aldolase/citrate lyase family protein [Clostridiales bacterium]|nr:aldolase/citrate lyase family protein [Clostridiales bacterium]